MKIVIVGGGKVGRTLADQLAREKHDIMLIDNDREVVAMLSAQLDIMVMYGNGASMHTLQAAEVGSSDLMIAVTPMDELNFMCCVIARKLGCPNTIARIRDPEYHEQLYFLRDELGLSMTVNPEWTAAIEIARLLEIPGFLKRDSFAKGRAEIVEIVVQPESVLCGLPLQEIHRKLKVRVLVCAAERGAQVFIPDGRFTLEAGDKLYVTAATGQLGDLLRGLGIRSRKAKDVLIIGGSRIALTLSAMLVRSGTRVKIIERSAERAQKLAELLPEAVIINADGTNQETLNMENISQMDAVITLTNFDEENLIISMFANYLGVPQVITKINRTEYTDVFRDKGIDCVVSPKLLCAQNIVRYVRAMQNTSGSSVITMYHLVNNRVEALEFLVTDSTLNLGKTLSEIHLKPDILIACINRAGHVIIPGGGDTIENGDTVIVVTASGRVILDLNDIFETDA